jgi:hypothetical protein
MAFPVAVSAGRDGLEEEENRSIGRPIDYKLEGSKVKP